MRLVQKPIGNEIPHKFEKGRQFVNLSLWYRYISSDIVETAGTIDTFLKT